MKLYEAFQKISDPNTLDEESLKCFSDILKCIAVRVGCDLNMELNRHKPKRSKRKNFVSKNERS
jgi:hypothetical protein